MGDKLRMWLELMAMFANANLSVTKDSWDREIGRNLTFSVMVIYKYNNLMLTENVPEVSPI